MTSRLRVLVILKLILKRKIKTLLIYMKVTHTLIIHRNMKKVKKAAKINLKKNRTPL